MHCSILDPHDLSGNAENHSDMHGSLICSAARSQPANEPVHCSQVGTSNHYYSGKPIARSIWRG
jgi:hypothetical protein